MQFKNLKTEPKLEFEWTDELAMEFARICSQGAYGQYRGCKKIEDKLSKFKEITTDIMQLTIAELEKQCSVCNKVYIGFGNNAQPLNEGRCCDSCNTDVIMARFKQIGYLK